MEAEAEFRANTVVSWVTRNPTVMSWSAIQPAGGHERAVEAAMEDKETVEQGMHPTVDEAQDESKLMPYLFSPKYLLLGTDIHPW